MRKIEVVDGRVEYRRVALVLVRDINVERARLERLYAAQAEFLHFPLEDKPHIDRRDGNRVVLPPGNIGTDFVQVVLAHMDAGSADECARVDDTVHVR